MAGSQGSFEDRIGKFKAGDTLVQSWGDYDPGNPLITKAACTAFITSVETANTTVITEEQDLKQARDDRKSLCFTLYDENEEVGILNPDCAQQRIIGVHSYVDSLYPDGHSTVDLLKRILDKVRPQYRGATRNKSFSLKAGETIIASNVADGGVAKNTGGTTLTWQETGSSNPPQPIAPGGETEITAPSGSITVHNTDTLKGGKIRLVVKSDKTVSSSPSERTFASIPGFLNEVITLVGGLPPGVTYDPPDSNLTVTEMEGLRDQIEVANAAVSTAMEAYGTANRERKKLYDGKNGMADRIAMIKSYLASFPGKKKSDNYIEYSQAIKGT
jgi:hypothetical protein